ncbi:importin-alpha export receptor, partial [Dimargaris verticillata]
LNDHHAFDLLNTLLFYADLAAVKDQLKAVLMLVLNRLQARNTPKYTRAFVNFVAFFMCLEKSEPTPKVLVNALDAIQPHILTGLLQSVIVPNLANLSSPQDRKTAVVGYLRLVQLAPGLLQPPYTDNAVPALLVELGNKLVVQVAEGEDGAAEDDLAAVDLVDVSAFQTNYSRLATISKQSLDPAPYVADYRGFFKQTMSQLAQSNAALLVKVADAWPAEVKAFMGV